jgi:hypothetical protein
MAKKSLTNSICALTIVLRREKLEYVLNTPILVQPATGCIAEELTRYNKHKENEIDV